MQTKGHPLKVLHVIDLDGTACNVGDRFALKRPKGKRGDRAYEAWLRKCEKNISKDLPVPGVRALVQALYYSDEDFVYLSSRREHNRFITEEWLSDNGFSPSDLYLRPENEHRRSHVFKVDVIKQLLSYYKCDTANVIDDDPSGLLEKECQKMGWTFLKARSGGKVP